jgi:hypothetical protein
MSLFFYLSCTVIKNTKRSKLKAFKKRNWLLPDSQLVLCKRAPTVYHHLVQLTADKRTTFRRLAKKHKPVVTSTYGRYQTFVLYQSHTCLGGTIKMSATLKIQNERQFCKGQLNPLFTPIIITRRPASETVQENDTRK